MKEPINQLSKDFSSGSVRDPRIEKCSRSGRSLENLDCVSVVEEFNMSITRAER